MVCNNVADVYRFAEVLKETVPATNLWALGGQLEVQDYVNEPKGGYRALHVNFRLDVGQHVLQPEFVPCEIQIRSRLQDAWAELSHDDIYKQPNLPEDLRSRAKDLAEVLTAADKIATDIRLRVTRETAPPEYRPDLGRVSTEGLAFVFREVFGKFPPDYAVRRALNLCEQPHVATLEKLPEVLGRTGFRDRVTETYRSIVGVGIGAEDVLLAAIHSVAEGDDKATRQIRRNARREQRELEQFARREAASSLPETAEELIESLEDPRGEADIELWAEALGANSSCAICGTMVILSNSFAESAVHHYRISEAQADETHQQIEAALLTSGAETGGWGDGSLCSYHHEEGALRVRPIGAGRNGTGSLLEAAGGWVECMREKRCRERKNVSTLFWS